MYSKQFNKHYTHIIDIGRLLWEKDLVGGLNGNISVRLGMQSCLITGSGTCLGSLRRQDLVRLGLDGKVIDRGVPSSEKCLHLEIYKAFPDVKAVVHTHTTFTTAFFLKRRMFVPSTMEAQHYLGKVDSVDQFTVNVADPAPVLRKLRKSRIVVLRRHGVVAVGGDLFECFMRIQGLEEQAKIQILSSLFK